MGCDGGIFLPHLMGESSMQTFNVFVVGFSIVTLDYQSVLSGIH